MSVEFWKDPRFKPALYSFVLVIIGIVLGEQVEPLASLGVTEGAGEVLVVSELHVDEPGTFRGTFTPDAAPEPDPTPDPEPVDPPVVVTEGPRHVVLVRETMASTPAIALELVELRRGENASYVAAMRHKIDVLDQDGEDEHGQPAAILETLRPHESMVGGWPAVFVLDFQGNILAHEHWDGTAEQVMDLLKANGG